MEEQFKTIKLEDVTDFGGITTVHIVAIGMDRLLVNIFKRGIGSEAGAFVNEEPVWIKLPTPYADLAGNIDFSRVPTKLFAVTKVGKGSLQIIVPNRGFNTKDDQTTDTV